MHRLRNDWHQGGVPLVLLQGAGQAIEAGGAEGGGEERDCVTADSSENDATLTFMTY